MAATIRLRPRGWYAIQRNTGTLVFDPASLAIFLAHVHSVLTVYARSLPHWLKRLLKCSLPSHSRRTAELMALNELSLTEARRIALSAQGFARGALWPRNDGRG